MFCDNRIFTERMDPPARTHTTEREFVGELEDAVTRYFRAVDSWEAAYRKYYRLPGYAHQVSSDLETEQREYSESRRRLQPLLARARGLCFKYSIRDPWTGLLQTPLGRMAPQEGDLSAVPPSERGAVNECLLLLRDAAGEWERKTEAAMEGSPHSPPAAPRAPWWKRVLDYFYY